jgi:structural maintenance of chromosome 1
VTYAAYNAALVSHNILVKAKNFLVFQGDVEAVASQSPRELTRLIEQISGSLELAPDYEKAKEAQERATENATFNFTKRRGITGEIRQYKEQKGEAERFEGLCQERVCAFVISHNYRLYAPSRTISSCAESYTNCSTSKKLLKPTPETSKRNHELLRDCVQSSSNMTRHWKMHVRIKLELVPLSFGKKRK